MGKCCLVLAALDWSSLVLVSLVFGRHTCRTNLYSCTLNKLDKGGHIYGGLFCCFWRIEILKRWAGDSSVTRLIKITYRHNKQAMEEYCLSSWFIADDDGAVPQLYDDCC